jgi:hypothetical protein
MKSAKTRAGKAKMEVIPALKDEATERFTNDATAGLDDSPADVVYPGSLHGPGRKEMLLEFKEIRKRISEKMTKEEKLMAKLLQLKFQLEDYKKSISNPEEGKRRRTKPGRRFGGHDAGSNGSPGSYDCGQYYGKAGAERQFPGRKDFHPERAQIHYVAGEEVCPGPAGI